jgi:hypothetical protein
MSTSTSPSSGEFVTVKSKGGLFPHTHTLQVPRSAIQQPPANGVVLTVSQEYSLIFKHDHQVRLTAEELTRIRDGQSVTVRDTDRQRHTFTIALGTQT